MRRMALFAAVLLLPALSGCSSLVAASATDAAGIAGAGISAAVTKSPALAAGIGVGVAAVATAGLDYAERGVHRTEQDEIAAVAGPLAPGVVGAWSVHHSVALEPDEHGVVAVARRIAAAPLDCKEIVFSVDGEAHGQPARAFYTATVCRDGRQWKWASAEPAVERWGSLQ